MKFDNDALKARRERLVLLSFVNIQNMLSKIQQIYFNAQYRHTFTSAADSVYSRK